VAFPSTIIRLEPNPYFLDLQREFEELGAGERRSRSDRFFLYVAEPIREHAMMQFGDERHFGYTEEEALRYFLASIRRLVPSVEEIVLRSHPAEPKDKYAWAREEFPLPISLGGDRPLTAEIVDADVVVGCESMAMVVAMLAKKRVISCIPPGGARCVLPHDGIEHLATLLAALQAPARAGGHE
jgi:hypothetical protein